MNLLCRRILSIILGFPRGSIIDVPTIRNAMGTTYRVGGSSNSNYGRALSILAGQGYLELVGKKDNFKGIPTTIHTWRKR